MNPVEKIKAIQEILGVTADGKFGPISKGVLAALLASSDDSQWHKVKASSFADPADIQAFKKCKATGKSDQECFKVGDNGIGKWGDDTTAPTAMCALPPEDWKPFGADARGKRVRVRCAGREVVCELRDTMPAKANIKNGAGIDLNPTAWAALGFSPPQMRDAEWQWV